MSTRVACCQISVEVQMSSFSLTVCSRNVADVYYCKIFDLMELQGNIHTHIIKTRMFLALSTDALTSLFPLGC